MKSIFLSVMLLIASHAYAQYTGTASVTQGLATLSQANLFTCTGGRVTNLGTITATDNSLWTVPASTNFTNNAIPFSSDLYNNCNGHTYASEAAALAALNVADVVIIDADGELITAYVFADNYFEMYINGFCVGKDQVPYTPFNSSLVRFRVKRPFSVAMHLVDWEENLGLGSELNGGFAYHDGDGGMVAVFKDSTNQIIAKTDATWKAQTFYTSPITDLSCPSENGSLRLSNSCSTSDVMDGSLYYALHWTKPLDCFGSSFNDSDWPSANTYSNTVVGVNNKPAYTNFTSLFDDANMDAEFIWTTNLILDNEVVVRCQIAAVAGIQNFELGDKSIIISPNPTQGYFDVLPLNNEVINKINRLSLVNIQGLSLKEITNTSSRIDVTDIPPGMYFVVMEINHRQIIKKVIIR